MTSNETKKISKKTILFRNVLKAFNAESLFTQKSKANKTNNICQSSYLSLHKGYQRIREALTQYLSYFNFNDIDPNTDCFLTYLLAILLLHHQNIIKWINENRTYPIFIKNCLTKNIPKASISDTSSPRKRGTYKKHISQEEMSFFLCFFKADSEITQKLGYQLTEEQNNGIERLIANTTLTPEEKFQKLMLLFYTKK